jgi:hypothetical protein
MDTFLTLLTGGGLALAGALLSAWVANWLGSKRDERRYKHEAAMAREARRQERLAQTYIELLTYLSHYADWAESVRPVQGSRPAPEPLPREERWRIEALVTAYGSNETNQLVREWSRYATKVDNEDAAIRAAKRSRPSQDFERSDWAQGKDQALRLHIEAMAQRDEAIRNRVSQELAGEA